MYISMLDNQSKSYWRENLPKSKTCVARGFEEEQNFRTDSLTCSREGVRISLACIATQRWTVNSIDIKTAFLQGKTTERTIYVRPLKEATTSKICKLRKAVCGLAAANRTWYLKIREELVKLGAVISKIDQGIFYWKEKPTLKGKAICFVDDIIWAGNKNFEAIIAKLKETFQVDTENTKSFKYIGIHINQNNDKSITRFELVEQN